MTANRNPRETTLALGDEVVVDGISYTWERTYRGTEAYLLEVGTRDGWVIISMPVLLDIAGPAKRKSTVPLRPSQSGRWPQDVEDMERHILEAFQGIPMDDTATGSRSEYDPTTTSIAQRVAAKTAELKGTSMARSERTLFRYWAAWQADGAAGICALMHRRGKPRLAISSADPRLIDVIDRVLDDRQGMSTSNRRHCAALVRQALLSRFPDDPVCDVKPTTLQGYINERDRGRHTFGMASTRRSVANQPKRTYRSGRAFRLGARVEIDSTLMDIETLNEHGEPERPWLSLMLDVASSVPLAWTIHFGAPNAFDHSLLLARAIVGRKAIPGREATRLSASAVLPVELMRRVNQHLSDDASAVPWIFPQCITIDGGADFRSATFEAACRAYGIDIDLAPPRTPTAKPHVERYFGTVASMFSKWVKGSVGNSVANRGKETPLWGLDGLREMFDLWVTTVYLNTPSSGLVDPRFASRRWTPNQVYAALFEVGPGVQLPFSPDEFIQLMPFKFRHIGRDGIHHRSRTYDSELLSDLRGRKSNEAGGRWRIHFDPLNTNAVWVRNPESGVWVEALDRALDASLAPMGSETSERLARAHKRTRGGEAELQRDWHNELDEREKQLGRGRKRKKPTTRSSKAALGAANEAPLPTRPVKLTRRSKPRAAVDLSRIDWDSPDLDIARPRGI